MDSRLLATLNAQARDTRNPIVWARAVCRAASHFARHGRTDDALVSIQIVRAQFKGELHQDVASWLMLAEGVLHYFRAETREAYDRIRRAYGLAIALRTKSALPSCAAWMAHIEFFDSKYDAMTAHLEEALTLASEDDHQAIARASLVLAMAYHLANEYELARPWYAKAKHHAAAEGDEATVSAMLHDVASYRASNVRLEDTFAGKAGGEAHRANMEVASSINYDQAIGHKGLDFLTLMLQGLILTIDKKFPEAISVFNNIRESEVPERLRSNIHADKAWCLANSNRSEQGWQSVILAVANASKMLDDDDIAYVYSRLSQTASLCQREEEAKVFRAHAEEALGKHKSFQVGLLIKINSISTNRKNPA